MNHPIDPALSGIPNKDGVSFFGALLFLPGFFLFSSCGNVSFSVHKFVFLNILSATQETVKGILFPLQSLIQSRHEIHVSGRRIRTGEENRK